MKKSIAIIFIFLALIGLSGCKLTTVAEDMLSEDSTAVEWLKNEMYKNSDVIFVFTSETALTIRLGVDTFPGTFTYSSYNIDTSNMLQVFYSLGDRVGTISTDGQTFTLASDWVTYLNGAGLDSSVLTKTVKYTR